MEPRSCVGSVWCGLLVALALGSAGASAAQYVCVIKSANFGDDVEPGVRQMFGGEYIGKSFSVDTRDGVMRGVLRNDLFKAPWVLNHGDEENSFVSAVIVSPKTDAGVVGVDTRILTIKTYAETKKKPFSLFWDDILFRGTCVSQ
jgi:hypothetical protein